MAERVLVSGVDLPEVPGLAVKMDDLLHRLELRGLPPFVCIPFRLRQDEHPGLDLELVRVPKLLLFCIERFIDIFRDHILDTDELGVFLVRIVDQALA